MDIVKQKFEDELKEWIKANADKFPLSAQCAWKIIIVADADVNYRDYINEGTMRRRVSAAFYKPIIKILPSLICNI